MSPELCSRRLTVDDLQGRRRALHALRDHRILPRALTVALAPALEGRRPAQQHPLSPPQHSLSSRAGLVYEEPKRPAVAQPNDRPIDKKTDDDWTRLLQSTGVRHVRLHAGQHTAATCS